MPASSSEKNSHQSNNKPSCEGTVAQEQNSQQSNNKPSCQGTVAQDKNSQQSNNKPSCQGTVTQVSDVERIALNLFSSVIRLLNETPDTNVIRSLVDKYDNLQAQQEHHQPVSVVGPVPQPDPDSLASLALLQMSHRFHADNTIPSNTLKMNEPTPALESNATNGDNVSNQSNAPSNTLKMNEPAPTLESNETNGDNLSTQSNSVHDQPSRAHGVGEDANIEQANQNDVPSNEPFVRPWLHILSAPIRGFASAISKKLASTGSSENAVTLSKNAVSAGSSERFSPLLANVAVEVRTNFDRLRRSPLAALSHSLETVVIPLTGENL